MSLQLQGYTHFLGHHDWDSEIIRIKDKQDGFFTLSQKTIMCFLKTDCRVINRPDLTLYDRIHLG